MNWHQACELPYYHGSDLGANPTAEGTTFKLWAPTACGVVVCLYATGTDAEPGAKELGVHEMRRGDGGVWAIVLPGNLHGTYYIYRIYFPDGRVHEVVDPYARSAGANGTRGMVVDLTQAAPDGWEQDRRPDIPAHARSVWEVHVADFSADGHSGVKPEWRGKFMGFTPDDTTLDNDGEHPTCLNYLKNLGISHVQLQPIYDYATVDESRPDGGYNWGYDPQNYNVPEGSFATDPFHGEVRVKECRAMVAALHRAGLGVVMDVVYNHTYHGESNLERTVPGYWNRRWPNGMMTNGSGCGCDLASERPMVRKYVVESVLYWATAYHIDGFRFDLMALEDVDTMNAIRAALDSLPGGESILLYGEPWMGGGTNLEGGARPATSAPSTHCMNASDFSAMTRGTASRATSLTRPTRAMSTAHHSMATMCCTRSARGAAAHTASCPSAPGRSCSTSPPMTTTRSGTSWPPWAAAAITTAPTPICWHRTA